MTTYRQNPIPVDQSTVDDVLRSYLEASYEVTLHAQKIEEVERVIAPFQRQREDFKRAMREHNANAELLYNFLLATGMDSRDLADRVRQFKEEL